MEPGRGASAFLLDFFLTMTHIPSMKIMFTGHRNAAADPIELQAIANLYPQSEWIHGGAKGFDTQVEQFAKELRVATTVFKPNYAQYGRGAPFVRNREMTAIADLVVACYDGRTSGGTFHVVQLARTKQIPCQILTPRKNT